jgi:hypothetical protein
MRMHTTGIDNSFTNCCKEKSKSAPDTFINARNEEDLKNETFCPFTLQHLAIDSST